MNGMTDRAGRCPPIKTPTTTETSASGQRRAYAATLSALLGIAATAAASENPTRTQSAATRGFDAKSAYAVSDVDSINLLSGALSVSIPIGPAMSVGPGLTYQLQLVYNSHPWDHVERTGLPQAASPTTTVTEVQGAVSFPALDNSVGLGWKLSLGELLPPPPGSVHSQPLPEARANTLPRWQFVGPDGAKHAFYSSLDAAQDAPGVEENSLTARELYTRDGSYVRLRRTNERTRLVEFPDGVVYEFHCPQDTSQQDDFWYTSTNPASEHCWRLVRLYDLRGGGGHAAPANRVDVGYTSTGGGRFQRTLQDAFGRRVALNYQANSAINPHVAVPVHQYEPFGWLTSVEFPAATSSAPGVAPDTSVPAVYTFDYGTAGLQNVVRGCHTGLATIAKVFSGDEDAPWIDLPPTVRVPLLQRVVLPDGSAYDGFDYVIPPGDARACNQSRDKLAALRYPTGATVRWAYGSYNQPPSFPCTFEPGSGDESAGTHARPIISRGVVHKVVKDAAGNVLSENHYLPASVSERLMPRTDDSRTWPADVCHIVPRQFTTTVVDERRLATVHYFNTFNEPDTWGGVDNPSIDLRASSVDDGWRTDEYGRNFTRYDWRHKSTGEPYDPVLDAEPPAPQDRVYLQTETYDCEHGTIPGLDAPAPASAGGIVIDGATLGAQSAPGQAPPQLWRTAPASAGYYRPNAVRTCGERRRATYVAIDTDLSATPAVNATVACVTSAGLSFGCGDTNLRTTHKYNVVAERADNSGARVEKTVGTIQRDYAFGRFATKESTGSLVGYDKTITRSQMRSAAPAFDQPWRLHDVAWTKKIQGGETTLRHYWFDPATGFLRAKRLVRDLQESQTQLKPDDVYVRYEPDANGHVRQERLYGGDLAPGTWRAPGESGPGSGWPSEAGHLPALGELGAPAYLREYVYATGVLAEERWLDPTTGSVLLTTRRNTVEPTTGRILRSEDAAGVGTRYGYDAMGRLAWTADDGLTQTRYEYCTDLRDALGNSLGTRPGNCPPGERNAVYAKESRADGSVLLESGTFYDAWGRLTETRSQYLGSAGSLNEPATRHSRTCVRHGVGGQIDQQLLVEDTAGTLRDSTCPARTDVVGWRALENRSTRLAYDVEGRETSKTAADGSVMTTTYNGDRVVTVETAIAVPAQNTTTFGPDTGWATRATKKITTFDSRGRLRSVSEPSRALDGKAYCDGELGPERPNAGDTRCLVTTQLTYDVNDQLVEVSTPLAASASPAATSQLRRTRYDALGWLVYADVPEMIGAEGQVSQRASGYDAFGTATRLSWRRGSAAPLRVVTAQLDALGRRVATSVDSGHGPRRLDETVYAFENGAAVAGRPADRKAGKAVMTKRYNPAFRDLDDLAITERYRYTHDAGLMTQSLLTASRLIKDGARQGSDWALATTLAYDAQGNLQRLDYPDCGTWGCGAQSLPPHAAIYEYQHGALKRIRHEPAARKPQLATLSYHPGGQTHLISHVVGDLLLKEEWNVDPMQRVQRMNVATAFAGGTSLIGFDNFRYDPSGNLVGVARNGAAHADRYWYDLAGRLVGGTASRDGQRVMQRARYDRFGNLSHLDSAGVLLALNPDARTNRLSAQLAAYDPFGNVVGWHGFVLQHDGLDMPVAHLDEDDRTLQLYAYGPGNKRVATFDSSTNSESWTLRGSGDSVLREVRRDAHGEPAWTRDTVHAGSRQLAAFAAAPADAEYRYFVDHLGSTRLVLDGSGKPFAEFDYLPFGGYAHAEHTADDPQAAGLQRFTGHERDAHRTGGDLDYMQARYYAPGLGRFLSLDPLSGTPAQPQSQNRYAYVRNSPLMLHDPTGMAEKPAGTRKIEFRPNAKRVADGTVTPNEELHLRSMEIERQIALDRGQLNPNAPATPRTGQMQREFKAAGMEVPNGYELDHGIDLQAGGKDDLSNARIRPIYSNRSAGPQMRRELGKLRTALHSPVGQKLKKFVPGASAVSIANSLKAGRYKEAAITAGGELPVVGWAFDVGELAGAAVQTETFINFLSKFQGDGRKK